MRKFLVVVFIGMALAMSFTGCKKETEMEQKLNAIEDSCEFVEISDTDENVSAWVSPEYLQEVEFNSQKNVYFGN